MRFFAFLLLVVVIVGAVLAWEIYVPIGPPAGTPDSAAVYVDIVPGTGTRGIAAQLQKAGVIRNRFVFEGLRLFRRGKLKAGEYRFNHPAPLTEVYSRIVRGDIYTVNVTIPEGYNIFDIAQAVSDAGLAPRDQFLAAEMHETSLIADLSPHAQSLEGYLFPDTYRFARHTSPVQMLSVMVRRFRKEALQLGLTKNKPADSAQSEIGTSSLDVPQTVTLASLVEKEVRVDSERALVAGVFINRLHQQIPLATDPSVIYAALLEHRYRGTIYESDLQASSAYNTYRHTGLPPGPICNPGVAALKAALAPAHTDYLYFVADAEGHSKFASTLQEHARQVQDYRRALKTPAQ